MTSTRIDPGTLALLEQEIVALHQFFEGWLSGRMDASPASFEALERALAPGFSMVAPDGRRLTREAVMGWLKAAHGQRGPQFRIWIEAVSLLADRGEVLLASYDECQDDGARQTRRRATGVFARSLEAPGTLAWLAVHETWVA